LLVLTAPLALTTEEEEEEEIVFTVKTNLIFIEIIIYFNHLSRSQLVRFNSLKNM
jgi:hypothetical protein